MNNNDTPPREIRADPKNAPSKKNASAGKPRPNSWIAAAATVAALAGGAAWMAMHSGPKSLPLTTSAPKESAVGDKERLAAAEEVERNPDEALADRAPKALQAGAPAAAPPPPAAAAQLPRGGVSVGAAPRMDPVAVSIAPAAIPAEAAKAGALAVGADGFATLPGGARVKVAAGARPPSNTAAIEQAQREMAEARKAQEQSARLLAILAAKKATLDGNGNPLPMSANDFIRAQEAARDAKE